METIGKHHDEIIVSTKSSRVSTEISHACIVIPTYNESDNIRRLLDMIFDQERYHNLDRPIKLSVLVVDDNSPDGTADIVRDYAKVNPKVHLLLRKQKNGLGAAYIAGMRHALSTIKPDVIFEMDADFSHDPKYIYSLLAEVRKGSDFVIGSRYVSGGSIPDNWGIKRKVISGVANLFTRMVIARGKVRDCTGGFRAIRTSLLRKIDFGRLNVTGYAFQISLLDAAIASGAKVSEVPIAFVDRTAGTSKMRLKDMYEMGTFVAKLGVSRII